MDGSKISVIIPVYNVEKYLIRCIDSVINQTYQNIEIILVDDGSTDNSGVICDMYSEKDHRIKVIHKKNGGLSDARNRGILASSGEYVFFVDSDDYIILSACEQLLYLALKYDADMVVCKEHREYENERKTKLVEYNGSGKVVELTSYEAGCSYLYGEYMFHSAWAKLYKRHLFDEILFPVGMLAEDYATTYLYISACNRIVFFDEPLYIYNIRQGSIMTKASLKLILDIYKTCCKKYEFEKTNYPEHMKIIETSYVNCLLKTAARIYNERISDNNVIKDIEIRLGKINFDLIPISSKVVFKIYNFNKKVFAIFMRVIKKNG